MLETENVMKRTIRNHDELREAGLQILEKCQVEGVLITRGADGMSLFEPDTPPLHIASAARQVFDVTGAGDTVSAALALALAGKCSLEEAARLGNRAAGIVVSKLGTTTV